MANHCNNWMTITGDATELKRFRDEVRGKDWDGKDIDLQPNNHMTIWSDDGKTLVDTDNKYPQGWGSRWVDNNYMDDKTDSENPSLQYSFESAWAPPENWLRLIVELFPTLDFRIDYEESSCDIFGYYTGVNGVFTDHEMTKHENLMENNDVYPELIKEIEGMTEEEICSFSEVEDFDYACCEEDGYEWPAIINEKYGWDGHDMYDFEGLSEVVIERVPIDRLPLFINLDWASRRAKERLNEGK